MAYPKSAIFRRLILEAWFAWHFLKEVRRIKRPVDTVVAVLNGLDWEENEGLSEWGRFRRRIDLDRRTHLVLFLGRLNFKKGLDLLVPAFAQVAKNLPEAQLALVGPDNEGYGQKVRGWCREYSVQTR
jgi:glycosyltransferase involved in cell wall biosynthesis